MIYYAFYKSYDKPCFNILTIEASNVDEAREKAIAYVLKTVRRPQEAYIVNAKLGRWVRLHSFTKQS